MVIDPVFAYCLRQLLWMLHLSSPLVDKQHIFDHIIAVDEILWELPYLTAHVPHPIEISAFKDVINCHFKSMLYVIRLPHFNALVDHTMVVMPSHFKDEASEILRYSFILCHVMLMVGRHQLLLYKHRLRLIIISYCK